MRCKQCPEKAVLFMPAHRLALCKTHYPPWFRRQVQRAIDRFRMVRPGERVLVAVSGGKDSGALWHALHHLGYETEGLYLHLGIGVEGYSDQSYEAVRRLAEKLGRPLHVVDFREALGMGIDEVRGVTNRPPCSACGLSKRYHMNQAARRLGFSVIATGHNLDDEAVTLLGNVLAWNTEFMVRQAPVLPEDEGFVRKVKPLIFLEEKQTTVYALVEGVPFERDECPFSVGSTNLVLKDVMYRLEAHAPGTKRRFVEGFFQWRERWLGEALRSKPDLRACAVCGYPTTGDVCAYCRLKAQIQRRLAAVGAP